MPRRFREWPFYVLAVTGSVGGALLGGYIGHVTGLTARLYWGAGTDARSLGPQAGLLGGLVAGVLWSLVVITAAARQLRHRGRVSPSLLAWGAFAGHGAALLIAGAIFGRLAVEAWELPPNALPTVLVGSALVGLPIGVLGGLLAWVLAALAGRPMPEVAAQAASEHVHVRPRIGPVELSAGAFLWQMLPVTLISGAAAGLAAMVFGEESSARELPWRAVIGPAVALVLCGVLGLLRWRQLRRGRGGALALAVCGCLAGAVLAFAIVALLDGTTSAVSVLSPYWNRYSFSYRLQGAVEDTVRLWLPGTLIGLLAGLLTAALTGAPRRPGPDGDSRPPTSPSAR